MPKFSDFGETSLSHKDLNLTSSIAKNLTNKILGFRANGGNVASGGAYVVGENGPEIFKPDRSGHIMSSPSSRFQPNGDVHIILNVNAKDANSFNASKSQIMSEIMASMQSNKIR